MSTHPAFPAPPGAPYEFFAYAKSFLTGNRGEVMNLVPDLERHTPRVAAVLKAATSAGTTTDPDWAGALSDYRLIEAPFADSLKPYSAFDAMLPAMRKVPAKTRVVSITVAATGSGVAEGQLKPISRMTLSGDDLKPQKAVGIVVISEELAAAPQAQNFIGKELQKAVGAASDQLFLGGLTGDTVPATADPVADIAAALALLTNVGVGSRLFLAVPAAVLAGLALSTVTGGGFKFPDLAVDGGSIGGIALTPTASGDDAVLVDASQVAVTTTPIVLDRATDASLALDDAPSGASVTSLWQNNLLGIRAERWFGAQPAAGAVAKITGVSAWVA